MVTEKKNFKWTHGALSLEWSHPCITFFPERLESKQTVSMEDVMYYYYTLTLRNKHLEKVCQAHDFPKAQDLPWAIDRLLAFNPKASGVLLEDYQHEGFQRRTYYHQLNLTDPFNLSMEYFMRFERYDYEFKSSEEEPFEWLTEYRLLIGTPVSPGSDEDCSDCFYLRQLEVDDLIRLKDTVEQFLSYSLALEA